MSQALTRFDMTPRQISLVKHTIAKDCNDDEFSLFMEVARAKGLDPFLGQIIPMVFNKDKPDKRKLTIIISRDGQRVIAQRCGDYRPASKPPAYEMDKDLMSETNPQGIVSATVYLWKKDIPANEWYEVAGQSFWAEMAPVADEWVYDKEEGKRKPSGKKVLDSSGNWCRMPRLMIAKCAEMQALRAGWPEQFDGMYDEAEMDRAKVLDLTATEIVEQERQENRLRAIGGKDTITVWWDEGFALENVPDGQFADRVAEHIATTHPSKIAKWQDSNRAGLQMFWARHPGDALALRKLIEGAITKAASDKEAMTVPMAGG
jgi:phage recombination protein Bet